MEKKRCVLINCTWLKYIPVKMTSICSLILICRHVEFNSTSLVLCFPIVCPFTRQTFV